MYKKKYGQNQKRKSFQRWEVKLLSFFNIRKVVNCKKKTELYLCRCWGISCGSRPGRAACSPRTSWHTAGHSPIGYKIIYMAIMAACSLRISWHTAGYSPIGYKIWNMVIRAVCPPRGFGYLLSQPVEELKQEAFCVKNKHFTSNICTAVGILYILLFILKN